MKDKNGLDIINSALNKNLLPLLKAIDLTLEIKSPSIKTNNIEIMLKWRIVANEKISNSEILRLVAEDVAILKGKYNLNSALVKNLVFTSYKYFVQAVNDLTGPFGTIKMPLFPTEDMVNRVEIAIQKQL
jgi:hypothetical protein